jgi:hypothetical protein
MKLTAENYHSLEANREYWSTSQFEDFQECELRAYHRYVAGDYKPGTRPEFTEGSFVHAWFEGKEALEKFIEENSEGVLSKTGKGKGAMKKSFSDAAASCMLAERNQLFSSFVAGEHEVIMTGDLGGAKWKIRVDVLNRKRKFFTDIKYMASLGQQMWRTYKFDDFGEISPSGKFEKNIQVPFYEAYDYWLRLAIYREVIRQNTGEKYIAYIAGISKETPPDIDVLRFDNEARFQIELQKVASAMPILLKVKESGEMLTGCDGCFFCRSRKNPTKVKEATSLF